MKDIILIGGGGHALSVADSIESTGKYNIIGYTDINEISDFPYKYLGKDEALLDYYKEGVNNAFICVGFLGKSQLRDDLYEKVKKIGFTIPVIIDKTAIVSHNNKIGEGTWIGKKAVINSGVCIGKMVIINTGAIIEHSCKIGDYSHISVGSILCGEVYVGKHTFLGANTAVKQCVTIQDDCIIGMKSTVLGNITKGSKLVGIIKNV